MRSCLPWLLCGLYCALVFDRCHCERFNVTSDFTEDAWQSSVKHGNDNYCFPQTATSDRAGHWDYFHSGDSPDFSSGYHWLLLKLTRGVRVLSVTVHAGVTSSDNRNDRSYMNDYGHTTPDYRQRSRESYMNYYGHTTPDYRQRSREKASRNIEVMISDRQPSGLSRGYSNCSATLNANLSSFTLCGRTSRSESANSLQEVRCSQGCVPLTRYLMLRRFVRNETNTALSFRALEIETAEISFTSVTKSSLARTWQSSSQLLESDSSSCFWQPSRADSAAGTFKSGSGFAAAVDRFHWFLLQLKQPVLLWQVQIQIAGSYIAASSVQVYNADSLPGELMQRDSCQSNWTLSNSGSATFWSCGGQTISGGSGGQELEFCCADSNYTRAASVILLRKEGPSAFQFASMRLQVSEAAQFSVCNGGKCTAGGLQSLGTSQRVAVKAKLPCQLQGSPTCQMLASDGTRLTGMVLDNGTREFRIQFRPEIRQHGAKLECRYRCSDTGQEQVAAETLGILVKPSEVILDPNVTEFWTVGQNASIKFHTVAAFPPPVHECWLLVHGGSGHRRKLAVKPISKTGGANLPVSLSTEHTLTVSASLNKSSSVLCRSHLLGTGETVDRRVQLLHIPTTRFHLPPNSSWKDGENVTLLVDSSDGNRIGTGHYCVIESALGNSSLQQLQTTNTSSTYSVTVTRQWGSAASVVCLVNQSGLIETWTRQLLPSVLYASEHPTIDLQSAKVHAGSTVSFSLRSGSGNPPAVHSCSIGGQHIGSKKPPRHIGSSQWQFAPQPSNNGQKIRCLLTQTLPDGVTVYSQSVSSLPLDVVYAPNVSWSATRQVAKEGGTLRVWVTSTGGNPVPSHRCWIQSPDGSEVTMTGKDQRNGTHLESKFSATSARRMNGGSVMCRVTQEGQPDMSQNLTNQIKIYYKAQTGIINVLSQQLIADTSADVLLNATDAGNPVAVHSCSVGGRRLEQLIRPASRQNASSQWRFSPLPADDGQKITCQVIQRSLIEATIYNQTVSSQSLSVSYPAVNSWTAAGQKMVVKEGESMSVSVTSAGGNPVPSHQCWILTPDFSKVKMAEVKGQNRTHIVSSFSVTSRRRMNGGSVMCRVTQEGQPDMSQNFSQSVTVFFSASSISWSGQLTNGTELLLTLLTEEGNPRPEVACSLRSKTVTIYRVGVAGREALAGPHGGWSLRARLTQRFLEPQADVTVTCLVSQTGPNSATIFGPYLNSKALQSGYSTGSRWSVGSFSLHELISCLTAAVLLVAFAATTAALWRRTAGKSASQTGGTAAEAAAPTSTENDYGPDAFRMDSLQRSNPITSYLYEQ